MSDGLDSHVPQVVSIQSQKTIAIDVMQHKEFSVLRQVSITMTYNIIKTQKYVTMAKIK
jgi:hypothetical protein